MTRAARPARGPWQPVCMLLRNLAHAAANLRYLADAQQHLRLFPEEKRRRLRDIAVAMSVDTFVETGTYLGQTTEVLAEVCQHVITIEIDAELHAQALVKFKESSHVDVLLGNSSALFPAIMKELTQPTLFWLDGHYSGGRTGGQGAAPILAELRAILEHPIKDHVVVIDDARLFRGRNGYPRLKEIARTVEGSAYSMAIDSDLIRIQRQDI